MIDIAAINALIVWKVKNPQWNQNTNHKRRLFLEELGLALVSHLLDFRSKNSKFLNTDILNALAIVGYPVSKNDPAEANENPTQPKTKKVLHLWTFYGHENINSMFQLFFFSFVVIILSNVSFVLIVLNKEHRSHFFL